jgi:hypothetical protein
MLLSVISININFSMSSLVKVQIVIGQLISPTRGIFWGYAKYKLTLVDNNVLLAIVFRFSHILFVLSGDLYSLARNKMIGTILKSVTHDCA